MAEGEALPVELIAGRLRLERSIGRGGMATVHEVMDLGSGRRLALKRLHPIEDPRKRRRSLQLFEREFHTLTHLAHPRVVEVYDYGIDELGPYYTMELLDGGDLQQQAPVPWQRACALARDIGSALSLLHSRRMVYRDLSPRNVRCTSDGRAKLIDFGAMVMMGPCKQVVGTPAYCAPEALNMQPLDARTDLYSLGATLYYTLVGRHAYPARDFKQLRDLWRGRPAAPSSLVPEIPAALDALVLDLLHLEPAARPANAAEVMERLAAIEGRPLDEHLLVSQSYLSAPNLVGREALLSRARAKTMRALRGRGGAILIQGGPGVGRSRFLDACLLEAKLLGALVLRADAADGHGDYGVVRALCTQLLDTLPEIAFEAAAPKLALLGHAVPELLARQKDAPALPLESADQLRARLQPALREWLLAVSEQRPLVLAVDDLHAIDEPSAAFVALLARDVKRRGVLVAVSVETDAEASSASALQLLAEAATKLELGPLSAEQTEKLLRSVFGDVPYIQQLGHRLYALSNGNPRDIMQLAQHLLDKGLVRCQAGAWTLPANIDAGDLPTSMAQALHARIEALSGAARELGLAMSLCPERSVSFDECAALCAQSSAAVMQCLDELVEAQIVSHAGEGYLLARRDWVHALHGVLDRDSSSMLHKRVAAMFERRGDDSFRVARHLLLSGEKARGLDALVFHAEESTKITHHNPEAFTKLVQSMPSDWFQCYEDAISLCAELDRPRRDLFTLQTRLAGLLGVMGILDRTHLPSLLDQLCKESGLIDWAALDPSMESMPRLVKALELTQARYEQSSERDRVLEPIVAIRQLARAVISGTGVVSMSLDHSLWKSLPSLSPLEPLSPALSAVSMLVRGLGARITGRPEESVRVYSQLLERLDQPDRAGLDESHHLSVRLGVTCGVGMVEAAMGRDSCLRRAEQIETAPLHQVNAVLIRMLHHLGRGETREADQCKERVELLRIQNSPRQWFEGTHLLTQVVLNAAADDLTRIKRTIEEIEVLAKRYPGWVPVHHYGLGEYHRIRGDYPSALQELEAAVGSMEPARHQLWPNAAGALARSLFEAGRHAEARNRAREGLVLAEQAGLGYLCNWLKMPLALAQSKLGETDIAVSNADAVIESLQTLGSKGLILALAYETRARVAVQLGDERGFEHYAGLYAEQLRVGASRVLTAKYERLKQEAIRAQLSFSPELAEVKGYTEPLTASQLTSLLDGCRGFSDRARQSLGILLRHSGATDGFLFTLSERGAELTAKIGDHAMPAKMADSVRDYIEAETKNLDVRTASLAAESLPLPSDLTGSHGEHYRMVLLSHAVSSGFAITGVAVAIVEPGKRFIYPGPIAMQLSKILVECGDVTAATVEG